MKKELERGIRMKSHLKFFLIILLTLGCSQGKIKNRHIRAAQKINGLSFSRKEINTMRAYLNENKGGYDSMRKFSLDYSVSPALYFDPRPEGFQIRKVGDSSCWDFPQAISVPESETELAFMTIGQLSSLIRNKKITSTELTKIYLSRIKQYNDTLLAVVTVTEDLALQQASKADEEIANGIYRGPLHGIPYGIKDLFAVPGYPTTWGAEPYQNQLLQETATVVKTLEEAGAVLVAKLTSGALARGDVWFGGQTKNPWDLKQGASGSSAGSASATAAGLVAFSIGTETMGSILSPSTRCGVTGLRPSFGAVSRSGAMTLAWSMDKVGPICRSAQDCAIVFALIKGKNKMGETDRSVIDYPFSFNPPADLSAYKIGYTKKLFDADTSRIGKIGVETVDKLRSLGADLQEISLPEDVPYPVFDVVLRAEAGAFFDELVRTNQDRLLSEQDADSRANSLRQARFIPAAEYLQANRYRKILIEKFSKLISDYDFIVVPTNGKNHLLITNMTGHPAISIPTGWDDKGHATSIVLIGNLYNEGPMLEAAHLFEKAFSSRKWPEYFSKK